MNRRAFLRRASGIALAPVIIPRAALGKDGAEAPGNRVTLVDRDLDWIVMKCLEKDRARRYPTAQELAVDKSH